MNNTMVLVQLVDVSQVAFNHIHHRVENDLINHDGMQITVRRVNVNANENMIDLSLYKLNHSPSIKHIPIENMNNRQFEAVLHGNNAYKYFITRGYDESKRELLQLFYNIPTIQATNYLNLARNYIIYFPHEMLPPNILHLNLSKNQLKDVPMMAPQLRTVKYSHNPIRAVPEQLPPNLTTLALSHTLITRLPNLPTTLTSLSLQNTKITRLPDNFHQLVHLDNLKLDKNSQMIIPEETLNFIETVFERRRARELVEEARGAVGGGVYYGHPHGRAIDQRRDVYRDGQNVHDTKINKEVLENVKKLLQKLCKTCKKKFNQIGINHQPCFNKIYHKLLPSNISSQISLIANLFWNNSNDTNNSNNIKLENYEIINYIMNQSIKFQEMQVNEIFYAYFNYVDNFEEDKQKEIYEILDTDLPEMRMVCCTGRVARLINTLSGISDDIGVKISEQAQIQAKHNLVDKKYINLPSIPQTILRCWMFKGLLEEIKVKEDVMNIWLEPYLDNLQDDLELEKVKQIRLAGMVKQTPETEYGRDYTILKEQLGGILRAEECLEWIIKEVEKLAELNKNI